MFKFEYQVDDLDAWAKIYLAKNEPLPTTVRNSNELPQVSEFIYLFTVDKTFGLIGTIGLIGSPTGYLPTDLKSELFVYPPGKPGSSLGAVNGDISKVGKPSGVTHKFHTPAAEGTFTIYIKEVGGAKQVWGHTIAMVSGHSKPIDEDLYLCPITPPASVFYGKIQPFH